LIIENYYNNIELNKATGSTWFDEPLFRGARNNTAWLGNSHFKFWQIHAVEVWTSNGLVTTSDKRYKLNIKDEKGALAKIMMLRPVTYDKIDLSENTPEDKKEIITEKGKNQHGLIAQEILKIYPEMVVKADNDYYGVKYQELITVLIKAMQEQQAQIDSLGNLIKK
jgi:hypothetical protein